MDDIICLHKVYSSVEAESIKFRLESAGIQCYLRSDNAGGMLPYLTPITGIGIMIRKEDEEVAIEALNVENICCEEAVDEAISSSVSIEEPEVVKPSKKFMACCLLLAISPLLYMMVKRLFS